jgi:hypothetical protein
LDGRQIQASELRPGVMLNETKVVEEPIIEVTNDAVVTAPRQSKRRRPGSKKSQTSQSSNRKFIIGPHQ